MNAHHDSDAINTLRFLAVDMVQKANSGHPGLPMGAGAMAYTVWDRFLAFDPKAPEWPDRDRFVLSAGHGSALLYSLLHLYGFDVSLADLMAFRSWGSRTPGHPEHGLTAGVEATTGPLGQGLANAVGMAIAEASLANRFNVPGHTIVDHRTYALVSDGDLMEGISYEATSLAGHLKLDKLTVLYDDNHISIEGSTDLAFSEDRSARFSAAGWQVLHVSDGNDVEEIAAALRIAALETTRPSFIVVRTHIGFGSPAKQDTASAHGEPLGIAEVTAAKQHLGWPTEPAFLVPAAVAEHARESAHCGTQKHADWQERFRDYARVEPELAAEFERRISGDLPDGWDTDLQPFSADSGPSATRETSGAVLGRICPRVQEIVGGSADLAPSTKAFVPGSPDFSATERGGRTIRFGVREHAMAAIVNGIALHGGLRPFGSTFLIFSDYQRPSLRLAAMGRLPVIHVLTHDSVWLGEDGPTHQPIEHLASLRAIPGLIVLRPADANETQAAWRVALESRRPTALVLTRQKLPVLDPDRFPDAVDAVARGGYVLLPADKESAPTIVATGSEVHLALEANERLAASGIATRVVSLPSWELFAEQPADYRASVIPPGSPIISIEAGRTTPWLGFGGGGVAAAIGVDRFGESAPGDVAARELGLTADAVVDAVMGVLA